MNIPRTVKGWKADCIGNVLHRNCLQRYLVVGKIEGTGRRWIRRKQLLEDFKENKICYSFKEDSLDCAIWKTKFVINY